jgi:UDP-glucose 4-epimerase
VVLASSAAIYGHPSSIPIHETDPKRPESPYGVDKLAADNYARVYGARFDVPVVVLRYFNVYGPGANAGVIRAFAERARAGEPLVIHGDGEQTRDFVHVDDVVRATLAATETEDTGRAFNVGTGERTSIAELADLVAERAPTSVAVEHAPSRSGDVDHSQAAIDRARSALDYQPAVGIREGIDSLVSTSQTDR